MTDPKDPLDDRLKSLEKRLKPLKEQEEKSSAARTSQKDSAGFAYAMRLSSEFIVAILVGAGIGWGIDKVLGTTPLAMIILLFLGFCAGVLNVMRSAGVIAENSALARGKRKASQDKEDSQR